MNSACFRTHFEILMNVEHMNIMYVLCAFACLHWEFFSTAGVLMFIQRLMKVLFGLFMYVFCFFEYANEFIWQQMDWNCWPSRTHTHKHPQRLMCRMICFYRIQFSNWNWQCRYFWCRIQFWHCQHKVYPTSAANVDHPTRVTLINCSCAVRGSSH